MSAPPSPPSPLAPPSLASLRVFYCDRHEVALPPGHRFPMAKYRLLREALEAEGILPEGALEPSEPVHAEDLMRVHEPAYVRAALSGGLEVAAVRRLGFPWSPALALRARASVGGTLAAAERALWAGVAGNLAGGTHHARAGSGSGYCLFNDLAVAARALLDRGLVRRVLLLDLDVHQGDGSAAIFADEPRVFTFSIHGERNYPFRKEKSDLDLALPDGAGDREFLEALRGALPEVLARFRPDLVLFQAGVDALESDRLGRLALTHEGLRARDAWVFGALLERRIPFALTLGGGYAEPLRETVEAHLGTYRALVEALEVEALEVEVSGIEAPAGRSRAPLASPEGSWKDGLVG